MQEVKNNNIDLQQLKSASAPESSITEQNELTAPVLTKEEIRMAYEREFENSPVVISFKNVNKTYQLYKDDRQRFLGLFMKKRIKYTEFHALKDFNLEIRKGESVGFVGRNGAGKSTLLKLVTGVAYPDAGKVEVKGQVAALLELAAGFDAEMTGRENIALKCCILGLSNSRIKEIEGDVVKFADIGEFMDQPVRTYSSGMKARLGFAINVSIEPDILVIDEALSVGDAAFAEKCRNKVSEIISKGVTVLFVSHAKDKLHEFCRRGVLMDKGQKLMDSDIDTIVSEYNEMLAAARQRRKKKLENKRKTSII